MMTTRQFVGLPKFFGISCSLLLVCCSSGMAQKKVGSEDIMSQLKKENSSHLGNVLPRGFVDLKEILTDAVFELRYAGYHNFVGHPIVGYQNARAVLTRQAAEALLVAQSLAKEKNFTLKIYDAYRPQKAVDAFVAWSHDKDDETMKAEFYPNLSKRDLFEKNYIFERSGHSRGSTVDLTLVSLPVKPSAPYRRGQQLVSSMEPVGRRFNDNSIDMGTGFDAFDSAAHTANAMKGSPAEYHRKVLFEIMEKAGFENYEKEWWHFTLRDEPYPDTYFDFDP